MTVRELNREQIASLKQSCLMSACEEAGIGISYDELSHADTIVKDDYIYEKYAGCEFVEEDFP